MNLGILKVGASLEQAGVAVDHLDLTGVRNYLDVVHDYLRSSPSRCFALTATTPQMPAATSIAQIIRPHAKVILGGPHPTLVNAAAKREQTPGRASKALAELLSGFDAIIAGDGERAIFRAMEETGLIDADDPKSELWQTSVDFNNAPWPARHLVDVDSYHYTIDGRRALSLVAQNGCPFGCNFSLTGDTYLFTKEGFEQINELANRLPLSEFRECSHHGQVAVYKFDEILATRNGLATGSELLVEGVRPVFKVVTKFGVPFTATAEHPVLAVEGETLVWREVKDLKAGDWITLRYPQLPARDYVHLDASHLVFPEIPPGGFTRHAVRFPAQLDEDLAWALGVMIGDGCIPSDGRPCLHVAITKDMKQRFLRVIKEKFGVEVSVNPASNTVNMEQGWIHSRAVREFFIQVLGISSQHKLTVPPAIRKSPAFVIQAFLDGLWDTDGYTTASMSYLTTVSKELAVQVAMLLFMVGKLPKIYTTYNNNYTNGVYYRVGIVFAERLPVHKSLYKSHKSGKWFWRTARSPNRTGIRRRTLRESGLAHPLDIPGLTYTPVQKVIPCSPQMVYDLVVPSEENFVANGAIVHNCGGRLSPMLRRMRRRSTENVIAEMLHLHEAYGVSAINFYDDELNVNPNLVDLMRSIQSTGIDWRLRGFVRSDLFTEEQAEAMYAAGFRWLLCGFESAHPRMLRNMNKKSTVANNTRMLHIAHQHGLKVKALMSFGHPAESEATILTTRDWLLQEKPDDFDCTIITTYPGCAYYDYARLQEDGLYVFETHGDKLYTHDVNYATDAMYYKGKPGDYKSYVWTDDLSPERLVELRDAVEAEVRDKLKIPFYAGVAALQFEHSMGQGNIPAQILRSSR
jgi:radical SAM superfamily enzyme YgiQ (UPF0313 family)